MTSIVPVLPQGASIRTLGEDSAAVRPCDDGREGIIGRGEGCGEAVPLGPDTWKFWRALKAKFASDGALLEEDATPARG